MTSRSLRARHLIKEIDERCGGRELDLLSVSMTRGVIPRTEVTDKEARADDLSNYKVCKQGDIVVNRMSAYQGALGMSHQAGIVSPDYIVFRPFPGVEPRWLHHVMRSTWFVSEMSARIRGIGSIGTGNVRTPRVSSEEIRDIRVSVPGAQEQRAIADFLDSETARIDALIEKKQRMVELLEARRAIYVRSCITGQAVKSAQDHGSESTGPAELPHGWHWIRARFLCDVDTGSSDTDESIEGGSYPFFVRSQTPQRSHRYIFDGEAVLTAGDGAGVGKVFHHFVGKFDAHQRVYVMHRFRRVLGRYYFYALSTFFAESALDGSAKSTVDSVRRHMLTEMLVPVPPLEVQEQIVSHLDGEMAHLSDIVAKVTAQLALLREHRQALITAAVTGQIEIPGVAA